MRSCIAIFFLVLCELSFTKGGNGVSCYGRPRRRMRSIRMQERTTLERLTSRAKPGPEHTNGVASPATSCPDTDIEVLSNCDEGRTIGVPCFGTEFDFEINGVSCKICDFSHRNPVTIGPVAAITATILSDCANNHSLVKENRYMELLSPVEVSPSPISLSSGTPVGYDALLSCERERRMLIVEQTGMDLYTFRYSFVYHEVPLNTTIDIGILLARLFKRMHGQRVVHGDISLRNIVFKSATSSLAEGLRIINFKKARILHEAEVSTSIDRVVDLNKLFQVLVNLSPKLYKLGTRSGQDGFSELYEKTAGIASPSEIDYVGLVSALMRIKAVLEVSQEYSIG